MKPATTTTTTGARSPAVRTVLDVKPGFQPRARYFAALTSNGFVPYVIADLTRQAIAYWQLRRQSAHRTGIEQAFLDAYLSQAAFCCRWHRSASAACADRARAHADGFAHRRCFPTAVNRQPA